MLRRGELIALKVPDALHARAGGFTCLAVVLGAAWVAAGFRLDAPIVALLIIIAITGVLRTAAREVLERLVDGVDLHLSATAEAVLPAGPGAGEVYPGRSGDGRVGAVTG